MIKMPIPDDWDGSTGCWVRVWWPNSTLWLALLRGLITNPNYPQFWDERTGDVDQVVSDFEPFEASGLDETECIDMFTPGFILMYAGSGAPSGWMVCDGSAISRADFPELFTRIGIAYGAGNGSTTFNLPDLRGRVAVGRDVLDTAYFPLGHTGGEKDHTLSIAEMPAHNHDISAAAAAGGTTGRYAPGGATGTTNSTIIVNKGGGSAHNNLQPYQIVNYIIRVVP